MDEWLTGNCWLLGPAGQNWMLVAGGGLLVYIAALAMMNRRQKRAQHKPSPRPPR